MGWVNNVDIIVDGKYHLEYMTPESLGLKFCRRVDDFNDLSKRFGDFSYTITLPITKVNSQVFGFADAHAKPNVFVNQSYPCQVYNNNKLLIDGTIELTGVNNLAMTFDVVLHSKISEFIDSITGKGLQDLQFSTINFSYEKTIVDWTNANYANSDEALLQFPLVFYNTFYTPYATYSGKTDVYGNTFTKAGDNTYQNFQYLFSTVDGRTNNQMFYHQFPPAIYMLRIFKQIFTDAGWSIGGTWMQDPDIKKIVMLYVGDTDVYDRAGVSGHTGGTSPARQMKPQLFLPKDMKQIDFVKGVINSFNLYFTIDVPNKIVVFETYDTWMGSRANPYDMTSLIKRETMKLQKADNAYPTIQFKAAGNQLVLGDNYMPYNYNTKLNSLNFVKGSAIQYDNFFSKNSILPNVVNINIPFGEPQTHRMYIYQDQTYDGITNYGMNQIVLPMISKQTLTDNNSHPFNADTGDTQSMNTESTIQYAGTFSMYYYMGQSQSDIQNKNNVYLKNILYVNVPTGTSITVKKMKFGICTPFMLTNNQVNMKHYMSGVTSNSVYSKMLERDMTEITYLLTAYDMLAMTTGLTASKQTSCSLVFDDSNVYHESLYTKYHSNKYYKYQNNNLLVAETILTDFEWQTLQINVPILYYGEVYHLVQIESYDPISNTATITLIKD